MATGEVLLSEIDNEVGDLFAIRKAADKDGIIQFVQVIGQINAVEAWASGKDPHQVEPSARKAFALSRLIAQRMYGRPLEKGELVTTKNGDAGDLRRENIELTTASELSKNRVMPSWSSTGHKYVSKSRLGRYLSRVGESYLGTYDTKEEAVEAVKDFHRMVAGGMDETIAARRLKGRARTKKRVRVEKRRPTDD